MSDPTQDDFLRAILAAPADPGPRLVLADWLEERGRDADAGQLRRPGHLELGTHWDDTASSWAWHLYWLAVGEQGAAVDIGPTRQIECADRFKASVAERVRQCLPYCHSAARLFDNDGKWRCLPCAAWLRTTGRMPGRKPLPAR